MTFRIVAISSNPDEFGLFGHVLVTSDGVAFEVGRQPGTWGRDQDVEIPLDEQGQPCWAELGCEIPRRLPAPPAAVLAEIFPRITITTKAPSPTPNHEHHIDL